MTKLEMTKKMSTPSEPAGNSGSIVGPRFLFGE
jgi:hypothetical protein